MKTGIMALVVALVLLMATVQTVAAIAIAFTAVGNIDYENDTTCTYGWSVEVWNLDQPGLGTQPWTHVTRWNPPVPGVDYGLSCEYLSEDDLIKVRITSPDGEYVGVNISRWGDVRCGTQQKTWMDVITHVDAKRGTCYEDTLGEGTVISENLSCSECFALAGANSWKNYNFESQCNPGYTVPRLCYTDCPQCCDGIDNDADSGIDWSETAAGDSYCACPLDDTEDVDEGCPEPCIPGDQPTDTFTKSLTIGWNLISLPLTPEDDTTSAVLGNDTIVYDKVYRYDATATPKQFVDVTTGTMEPGIGYFVYVTTAGTWNYTGTSVSSTNLDLKSGLNMIGVPNCTIGISDAMGSEDYRYVARWNAAAVKFEVYNLKAPSAFHDFTTIAAGEGYFISASSDYALTVSCPTG